MLKAICLPLLFFMLIACQNTPVASTPTAQQPTAISENNQTPVADFVVQSQQVIAAEEAGAPQRLVAPSIDFAAPIEAMGWQVTQVEGERKAVWQVPENSVGWHLNSAQPGTAGNMVLSGHHLLGAAVFAPLARGELALGAPLLVTDDQGRTFLYQVSAIGEPIPAIGGTPEEQQQAEAYLAPSSEAKLTLMTGWPDFSDTHYLFISATFTGVVQ